MKSATNVSLALIFGFSLMSTAMVGCEDETAIEEVGEDIDEAVEDTGDAIEDTGEEVEDAID